MVDFQSRETRRHSPQDDGTDDEEPAEDRTAEAGDETETRETGKREVKRGVAVITVGGDDPETGDPASEAVADAIERAGTTVVARETADATYDTVQGTIDRTFGRRTVSAIVTVGGVGIGPGDVTVEAVEPFFDKHLPGFGELFRVQYFDQIGPDVVGMRPIAGVTDDVPVFCLPGQPAAARFAVENVLAETLDTLVTEAGSS